MFVIDLPYNPPPITILAQSTQGAATTSAVKYDVGVGLCRMVQPGPISKSFSTDYALLPVTEATALQDLKLHKFNKELWKYSGSSKVTVIQSPEHGILVGTGNDTKYYPHLKYFGKDIAAFLVEIGSYKIKVFYELHVQHGSGTDEGLDQYYCPKSIWKISNPSLSYENG